MKLRYTPQARMDLREIKTYISTELGNTQAAARITSKIVKNCSDLEEWPNMGESLAEKTGRNTDLRYLISGNHLIFYRLDRDWVSVVRILDGRTSYLHLIFGSNL